MIFRISCLDTFEQGTTIAEEEEVPVILRHAKQKKQAQKEREQITQADSTTIAKLQLKFDNLQKVALFFLSHHHFYS